ncbi:hypothetical protein DPMN_086299 [Dreissena polymorpha]|uniref:Uncharacterized protein n=1 Tax=Dreissena polymorpha TaxID=45954 RepID=A0A9D4QV20_DREPO|nr:hypothetical protein DPMN_086299 [Dreissena polymorpha]
MFTFKVPERPGSRSRTSRGLLGCLSVDGLQGTIILVTTRIHTDKFGNNTQSTRRYHGLSRQSYVPLRTNMAETRISPENHHQHGIYKDHPGRTRQRNITETSK